MAHHDRGARGPFAEHLADLVGLPVWSPRQGHGSFLTFDFGDSRLDASGHVDRGAWHLWIQMAAWRIEDASTVLAGCEDTGELIAVALAVIDGRELTSITATGPALDTVFSFSDVHLRTFGLSSRPSEDDRLDNWWLFRPDDQVLAVAKGGTWTLTPADAA
ncbi:hypothetical protein [Actinotalea sp. C106]|uniref:hypothetical protein n=1 Tax=Actinotalea sp. C106 TaxID=2908644 RepID=UPI0020285DC6|nr:hypothetical protein [Actinotalea sp. C106]